MVRVGARPRQFGPERDHGERRPRAPYDMVYFRDGMNAPHQEHRRENAPMSENMDRIRDLRQQVREILVRL